MKKILTTSLAVVFVLSLLVVANCGDKAAAPGAAVKSGGVNLLTLIPDNVAGVATINFKAASKLAAFDDMIKKAEEEAAKETEGEQKKAFKSYQDFVTKTGIDPKKDVHGMVIGFAGDLAGKTAEGEKKDPDMVMVASVDYDKAKLLATIKESGETFTETDYNGVTILTKEGDDFVMAFVNDGVIAGGMIDFVKKSIDLSKGQGKSVLDNAKMKGYIDKFDANDIMAFVMDFPAEAKKEHDMGMAKFDLSQAEAILGGVQYGGNAWTGEIAMICPNEAANTQLVTTLNGFKGMAAMGGPEVAEVVNNMTLAATPEKVSLTFKITDEMVEKLKKKAEEKVKEMAPPPPPPAE